jgi:hypothetical protein
MACNSSHAKAAALRAALRRMFSCLEARPLPENFRSLVDQLEAESRAR